MRLARQIAIVAALTLAAAGAWYAVAGSQGTGSNDKAAAGPGGRAARPIAVVAGPATRGDISVTFDAIGTLRANEAVTVTAKTAGFVKAIRFMEGQQVGAGDVLVELDDTEAQANLAVAESEQRNAAQQLERSKALLTRQAVAQARVDELRTALQGAEAAVRAARARLQDLTIRAPFAGVAGLRQVSPGALVRPADPVTTLDDIRVVKLEFSVPETALQSLGIGLAIEALSTVYPGEVFRGTVHAIDTRIDPLTRSIKVVAELPNPALRLKPGMFMNVRLTLDRRIGVVLIPEEALIPVGDQQFVFVVADGKVQRRPIRIGARQGGRVQVVEGLQAGDLVVTRGTLKVRDGAPVQATVEGGGPVSAASQT